LGSGKTWPHDFLFLVGFLSPAAAGVAGVPTDSATGVRVESADTSNEAASAHDLGVIISWGLSAGDWVPKREGYISSGVERKDSAGECSNLRAGLCV